MVDAPCTRNVAKSSGMNTAPEWIVIRNHISKSQFMTTAGLKSPNRWNAERRIITDVGSP